MRDSVIALKIDGDAKPQIESVRDYTHDGIRNLNDDELKAYRRFIEEGEGIEIEPCPFCGGRVFITGDKPVFQIRCSTPGCFIGTVLKFRTLWFANKGDLIRLWNRRSGQ